MSEEAAYNEIVKILEAARKKSFNEGEARKLWDSVLEVARFHARDPQTLSAPERKKAKATAMALGEARKAIKEALKLPNLENSLFGTWEMAQYHDESVVYLRREADFHQMVDGLGALEDVARQVAAPRRRGRPGGTALMPAPTINHLASVYVNATDLKAGAGEAPFRRFVSAFAKWFVRGAFENDAVVKSIQRTKQKTAKNHPADSSPKCNSAA
jgi:hypothetical protein